MQSIPDGGEAAAEDAAPVNWQHYWHCQPCSYPDRTGDLASIVTIADFYPARQWRAIGTPLRHQPAAGIRTRSDADPAHTARPARWAWPDRARVLFPPTRAGISPSATRAVLTLWRPHL